MITYFLVGAVVVCAGLILWMQERYHLAYRLVQILAIGCLMALLMTGETPMADACYWLVLAGLGFALVGDLSFHTDGARHLRVAIGAMVVCYLFYAAAFSSRMALSFSLPALLFYLVIPATVLLMVGNQLGTLRWPVLFLSLIMAVMAGQATTQYLVLNTRSAQLVMGGVLFFFLVDGAIAIDHFGAGDPLPWRKTLIELSNYSAQLLITLSALA